jgi:hypothetical protein
MVSLGVASYSIVRTAARKADERNFIVSGHTAWVCRLIAEGTEQLIGVRLRLLRPSKEIIHVDHRAIWLGP